MNIDDGWEAKERNADGTIAVNQKFPSMKDLGDWLHSEGLKFGIYSSPGDLTCGGYLGSIDHELQDAESYNSSGAAMAVSTGQNPTTRLLPAMSVPIS